jgi:dihydroxy-acid dehydratase
MRSDNVKTGAERAPNRSLMYALGLTKEEMERPLIGIVDSRNDVVPGHMHLDKITEAVKTGVLLAGGTPLVFPAIAVCDGIAMGHEGMKYSLVTRELIADSTEAMAMAHQFDGLVMIPNCDKNVPGLLMAAARINIPTIFCSGGPMMAGQMSDGTRTCLSDIFEAVGAYKAESSTTKGLPSTRKTPARRADRARECTRRIP